MILIVQDIIQIEGRGTVAVGERGVGWASIRPNARIELRSPTGERVTATIRDFETCVRDFPPLGPDEFPRVAILFSETVTPEQAPRGTQICEIVSK